MDDLGQNATTSDHFALIDGERLRFYEGSERVI